LQAEGIGFRGRRVDMKAHEHKFGRTKTSSKRKTKIANAGSVRRP
jgi:uncharacterized C2H2 Zn-finger protein